MGIIPPDISRQAYCLKYTPHSAMWPGGGDVCPSLTAKGRPCRTCAVVLTPGLPDSGKRFVMTGWRKRMSKRELKVFVATKTGPKHPVALKEVSHEDTKTRRGEKRGHALPFFVSSCLRVRFFTFSAVCGTRDGTDDPPTPMPCGFARATGLRVYGRRGFSPGFRWRRGRRR